jgi:hypothetical protein
VNFTEKKNFLSCPDSVFVARDMSSISCRNDEKTTLKGILGSGPKFEIGGAPPSIPAKVDLWPNGRLLVQKSTFNSNVDF